MDLSNDVVLDIKKENQEFLQFKKLLKYSNVISHCYSLGIDKNYRTFRANRQALPKEEYEKNIDDYKTLCTANGLNYKNIVKASQAHTDNILNVNSITQDEVLDTSAKLDGLITNQKGIILATTNADCILLLMFDPVKKVIANVHSGWRGTLQEISVKIVERMVKDYGCNAKDIIVCICPSIRKCHFEVDRDVYEMFYERFKKLGDTDRFISQKGEKWYIDTVLINKIILNNAGILMENIEDSGLCSVCNKDKIHSFRAEGEAYGLETALISLK